MSRFDGGVRLAPEDHARLAGQIKRVYDAIADYAWHTLRDIATNTDAPEASVSAQLRNLRKPRFGGHVIDRKHLGNGLYAYRLVIPERPAVLLQERAFDSPELVTP